MNPLRRRGSTAPDPAAGRSGTASWPAPAKINLFLHILGRRNDGYHELQTVFQFLDLHDELEFDVIPGGGIELERDYGGVEVQADLVWRAAERLNGIAGGGRGARISVHKRIPQGGGLGGGSSDAATSLLALNELWDIGLPPAELARLGLELGADVPVFLQGHAAWAEGVGERLVRVDPPEDWYLLIHPGCEVATRRVFGMPGLTRNSPPITIRHFIESGADCRNDCETEVYRQFPEIARAAAWLGRWTPPRLSGTGACVYGRFDSQAAAMRVSDELPPEWRGYVSRGRNISPVLARLDRARAESPAAGL